MDRVEAQSKLETEETLITQRLAAMIDKLIDYSLNRITEYMSKLAEREISRAEALRVLEDNPELLNPKLVDEAIALNPRAMILINTISRLAGSFLKNDKKWYAELSQKGDEIIMIVIAKYRPDLMELLKDKPKLTAFLCNYVLHKLGIR